MFYWLAPQRIKLDFSYFSVCEPNLLHQTLLQLVIDSNSMLPMCN